METFQGECNKNDRDIGHMISKQKASIKIALFTDIIIIKSGI